jgi:polyhydroxybutyrate depolymerase
VERACRRLGWASYQSRQTGTKDDTVATANGCPKKPTTIELPDKVDDGTTVRQEIYGPGKDGAEVVLFVINGGGHTWPGRQWPVPWLGKTTKDISANDLMWEFFQKHPMK